MEMKNYLQAAELLFDKKYYVFRTYSKLGDLLKIKYVIDNQLVLEGTGSMTNAIDFIEEMENVAIEEFKNYLKDELLLQSSGFKKEDKEYIKDDWVLRLEKELLEIFGNSEHNKNYYIGPRNTLGDVLNNL